jgi:7 transmembrane receptor (rhodopsin family)
MIPDAATEIIKARNNQQTSISRTMSLIIGSFLICWLPEVILTAQEAFSLEREPVRSLIKTFCFSLTILNALLDPMIFAYRSKPIMTAFQKAFNSPKEQKTRETGPDISSISNTETVGL